MTHVQASICERDRTQHQLCVIHDTLRILFVDAGRNSVAVNAKHLFWFFNLACLFDRCGIA